MTVGLTLLWTLLQSVFLIRSCRFRLFSCDAQNFSSWLGICRGGLEYPNGPGKIKSGSALVTGGIIVINFIAFHLDKKVGLVSF